VLTKVDRAAMAHGLEVRPPFLDNELIDWAFRLPSSLKLRGGRGKYLLKLAGRDRLPSEILHRRKKGFGIPLGRWLRVALQPRLNAVLDDSPLWSDGMLSRATLRTWRDRHIDGRGDYSRPLWALLVLDHWARRERTT
jgi:asparagine synthase (glutamine-hydrolysing)